MIIFKINVKIQKRQFSKSTHPWTTKTKAILKSIKTMILQDYQVSTTWTYSHKVSIDVIRIKKAIGFL